MATSFASFRFVNGQVSESDIRLDARGNLTLISGAQEVEERVRRLLLMPRGDNIFNRAQGIPYVPTSDSDLSIDILHAKPVDAALATAIITSHTSRVDGVKSVTNARSTIDPDTRLFEHELTIETEYGEVTI